MSNNAKRKTILKQIQRPLLIFFIAVLAAAAVSCVFLIGVYSIRESMGYSGQESKIVCRELAKYNTLSELADYWVLNYESMELVYDDEAINAKEKELRSHRPELGGLTDVTPEEFLAFDEVDKKLFAEVCYGRMSNAVSILKQTFMPVYMFTFVVRDEQQYFLVTGAYENELRVSQGGDLFELGTILPYMKGTWEHLDRMLEGDQAELSAPDHIDSDFSRQQAASIEPIFDDDGNIIMFVGVSVSYRDLILNGLSISKYLLIVIVVIFILLEIQVVKLLKRNVSEPISHEEITIRDYMQDKDSGIAVKALERVTSNNEVQSLAESFSSMITELDHHMDRIQQMTTERERISAELNVATQIQAEMLPSVFPPYPDRKEFELFASMNPAKEVGGDFYDFFFTDDDHIVLVMADVSGKGVPAALFMAISKTNIKNRAIMGGRPADIIAYVNDSLYEGNDEGMFVTVWFTIIELSTGKGISVNAGHEHPFIRHEGGKYEPEVYKHNMMLGAMPTMVPYTEREFTLKPGDTIFIYTDGVPEANNAEGELFGLERLEETLNREPDASVEGVISNVTASIDEYAAGTEQFDDITMLAFKYFGPVK